MPFLRQQRRSGGNLGLLLLGLQIMNFGVDRIPPVTLIAIASQVAIFLGIADLSRWFPSSSAVCISSHLIWRQGQWKRLLFGVLYHANDIHLYYNMVSLLWKGSFLERKFKSAYFAYMLVVFSILSSLTLVGLNIAISEVTGNKIYELECGVGFSGVLFALKVLTVHYSPRGLHYVMGFIPVPSKYVYWAELAIIQLIVPNASFTGHLAGILVGLAYIKGPVKPLMDSLFSPEPSYTYQSRATGRQQQPYNTPGYTTGGRPMSDYRDYQPDQRANAEDDHYNRYTGGLTEEEQMQRAMDESRRDNSYNNNANRLYPDLDDLRQRRAQHYT